MSFVLVQRGSWPGWSPNADVYLETATGAAYLTAARDYHLDTGRNDAGIVEPLGGVRTAAEIAEMQWAFDHRHSTGADKARSVALYAKYNMDPNSNARPATSSTHLRGICIDIASTFFLNWLIINGRRYGLVRPAATLALNDIRHFQFFPGTATAALDVTSLDNSSTPTQEANMSDTRLYQMIDGNGADLTDWSRIGADVLPVGTFPGGYEATSDHATAVLWGLYSPDGSTPIKRERDAYLAAQQFGAKEYKLHRADQIARMKEAGGSSSPTDLKPILDAITAGDAQLLTAISQVDENTLATFGLKRA